jgi:hypothetical protein
MRDEADLAFTPVEATDALDDDGGHAAYALACVRLDEPPRRRRERIWPGRGPAATPFP